MLWVKTIPCSRDAERNAGFGLECGDSFAAFVFALVPVCQQAKRKTKAAKESPHSKPKPVLHSALRLHVVVCEAGGKIAFPAALER